MAAVIASCLVFSSTLKAVMANEAASIVARRKIHFRLLESCVSIRIYTH